MDNRTENYFITDNAVEVLEDKEVYLFGAGTFGEDFLTLYDKYLKIMAYIDNSRAGYCVNEKDIISLKDYTCRKTPKSIIIITTEYYSIEIAKQLMAEGQNPGENFYIWDPKGTYHMDGNTKKYVDFNKKVWGGYKRENTNKKVLIPFMRSQDTGATMYAYVGNYLSEKYDAQIVAYVRGGRARSTISDSVRQVYESFNTTDIITPELREEQILEAKRLLDEIWPQIHCFSDWHNINIYGISIGTVIIQNYLRYEVIQFDYNEKWYDYLRKAIGIVVFWYDWFRENDVATVVLLDSGIYDGYMRDIACHMGIPVYCIYYTCQGKLCEGYSQKCNGERFPLYKAFWDQLTPQEQAYGIEWAKKRIGDRLAGQVTDINYGKGKDVPFTQIKNARLTEENEKMKVLICPHIFEEESIHCGWQIFGNYVSWLLHLGELSEQTDYDWYLKKHPVGSNRDQMFFEDYCKKYKKIKLLPINASPNQLAAEGVKYAFTVCGTLGHEYPMIGINVINAGNNPHIAYDFDFHPSTEQEFDDLVFNLEKLHKEINVEDIYKFFCIHFLYYKCEGVECWKNFFINPKLVGNEIDSGSWKYQAFMDEWSQARHREILHNVKQLFKEMDERKTDVFYRW